MNKAIRIQIAGTSFTIEPEAHLELQAYLHSIKSYFDQLEDGEDIFLDIESRTAELLLEEASAASPVITRDDINSVKAILGTVADFKRVDTPLTSESQQEDYRLGTAETSAKNDQPLRRIKDDKVIAGVCAGIAKQLNVSAFWVRLGFVLLLSTSVGYAFEYTVSGTSGSQL